MHDVIIEPFAGTAKYSLKHWHKEVILYDKYELLVNLWKWLQTCSPNDILTLPVLKMGQHLNDFEFDCEEAKHLIGFNIAAGDATPRGTASIRTTVDRPTRQQTRLRTIAKNLHKIKHWQVIHGSYESIENREATWFIDPPYQTTGGHYYKHSNKEIDFAHLAGYCMSREGQVIVCESTDADWLPFQPMMWRRGYKKKFKEAIWSNMPTVYDHEQQQLFPS